MDLAISTVRALEEAIRQVDRGDGVEATDAGQRGVVVAQGEGGPTGVDILINGETGTGKEVVARAIHDASGRRGAFVAINCGALPETVFESELFDHEAGAFTGAGKRRIGRIEHAGGGTLFLDEIESMPLNLQVKLLRVLQERSVERLGSNAAVPVDCRLVAASKADLKALSDAEGGELGPRAPFGRGGFEIAALSAGLALRALGDILSGEVTNAYALTRPPGHHCLPDHPNGFCLLANIAIAIEAARAAGQARRFAVIDWDVQVILYIVMLFV